MAKRADIKNDLLRPNHLPAVAVPDLQIRGCGRGEGGGGGHPDPEIRGAPVSKKFFSALRASVWSKYMGWGGGGGGGSLPWIRHCLLVHTVELPPSRCLGEADKLYATVTSYLKSCIKSESTLNKEKKDI